MATPQQIAREIDIAAVREMFQRKEKRRARFWRFVIVRLPQACFLAAVAAWIGWTTWSAIADMGNGVLR